MLQGRLNMLEKEQKVFTAYVTGTDGKEYSITENIYSGTDRAREVIKKGNKISFVPEEGKKKALATLVKPDVSKKHAI